MPTKTLLLIMPTVVALAVAAVAFKPWAQVAPLPAHSGPKAGPIGTGHAANRHADDAAEERVGFPLVKRAAHEAQ